MELVFVLLLMIRATSADLLHQELNETVLCSNDLMELILPSAFFLRKTPPVYVWDLHLNDPECRGEEIGDEFVFSIRTNLSDCGTVVTAEDGHILFTNTISHNQNQSDVITRNYINITFVCRYPNSYMVQQKTSENQNQIHVDVRTITLNTEDGNFSVSMLLFKDPQFQDQWKTIPSLRLEDTIYVKVHMTPPQLRLRMEQCWATPTSDPYSNVQYSFIRDSCPVQSLQTLRVLQNGLAAAALFRIQMFKFVGGSYSDVFLHCNIHICHSALQCQLNCSADDGLLRLRRDASLSHTVSYGPIRRAQEKASTEWSTVPPVETLVLAGLLLVLVLVLVLVSLVLGRLWLRSRRFYPTYDAQLTLSNMHRLSQEVAS